MNRHVYVHNGTVKLLCKANHDEVRTSRLNKLVWEASFIEICSWKDAKNRPSLVENWSAEDKLRQKASSEGWKKIQKGGSCQDKIHFCPYSLVWYILKQWVVLIFTTIHRQWGEVLLINITVLQPKHKGNNKEHFNNYLDICPSLLLKNPRTKCMRLRI